jgi:predicted DNA-binding protein with PD1-like motif
MFTQSTSVGRLILVRMDSGDDILGSLTAAIAQHGIKNGVILGGVGSICSYHIHTVGTMELPPHDVFLKGDGPFDILSLNGLILDGRVHAHITFSNTEKAMGGHLEEGCHVLTFSVAYLRETPDVDLTGWDRIGRLKADQ